MQVRTPALLRLWRWLAVAVAALAGAAQLGCAAPASRERASHAARSLQERPLEASGGAHRLAPARERAGTVAEGAHGAVSSAEAAATAVGEQVLQRGGNAVDAAVAVAFALGVTHPSAANIGGGGFMVVRLPDGFAAVVDYREVAPRAAHRDMYLDAQGHVTGLSRAGPLAAGIPGVVAGLAHAHRRFGSLPWAELLAPAMRLARDGHRLDGFHAQELQEARERVRGYRDELTGRVRASARTASAEREALAHALDATLASFSRPDGSAHAAGELWRQPELANTLEAIAADGEQAFYRGPLALSMATQVRGLGGIWTAEDLAGYRAIERPPITFSYRGHQIITVPPPSAGGVVLRQIMAGAELLELHTLAWDAPTRVHLFVEILRRAYADRNQLLGDPAFAPVALEELLSTRHVARRMADIDRDHATPSSRVGAGLPISEPPHTTHFSVIDGAGMAVANTFTLNTGFGALVQVPGTGVILNNEMDDFTAKPGEPNLFGLVQGAQNAIAPGKRMLSSMSPTVVAKDGKVRAVLGSPGGPTITTTVAQILMQLVDHGRSLPQAIAAPRVHHQWLPDHVSFEPGLAPTMIAALRELGHTLELAPSIGHANCIEVDPATGLIRAVADVARGGGAAQAH